MDEFLTRWTVRIAVMLYVASLAARGNRIAWSAGCLFYLAHVVCAFAYFHRWSHDEAFAATARQTAETVGFDWGGGLYVNYVFTLVWTADVIWWWSSAASYHARPRWLHAIIHAFLGFIVFNATVVFATGFSRWFGVLACALLAFIYGRRYSRGAG